MSMLDPRILPVLEAAQASIETAAETAVAAAIKLMPSLVDSAPSFRERGRIAFAKTQLFTHRDALMTTFRAALRAKVVEEMKPKEVPEKRSEPGQTDWEAIGLVEEDHIEERLSVERIGSAVAHECEAELRELNAYFSTVLRRPVTDPDTNPVRANVVGHAMHQAIDAVVAEPFAQRVLEREIGKLLAAELHATYAGLIANMKASGFRRAELVKKPTEAGSAAHEESLRSWERSIIGRMPVDGRDPQRRWEGSMVGGRAGPGAFFPPGQRADGEPEDAAALLDRLMRGGMPLGPGTGLPDMQGMQGMPGMAGMQDPQGTGQGLPQLPAAPADPELLGLLRRLTGNMDTSLGPLLGIGGAGTGGAGTGGGSVPPPPNLIRLHREMLVKQSPNRVDQLVIEVVGSLFDQILTDPQVPPQMARQIARLQLPVLRVALRDADLFALRRHPVRRFINRVASLATAMEGFDTGPGMELLLRVRALIDEIVEGDFEQIDLYGDKMLALEAFSAEQAKLEAASSAAAATLDSKEREWVQLSHFSQRLATALKPLAIAPYLKDFIAQTWAEVILRASMRDGEHSTLARRFRSAGADLLGSVLPQRTIDERRAFLAALPGLMTVLNEGGALIQWPEAARNVFFGKLMADHAGSLKTAPPTELDYNLLLKNFQAVLKTPIPAPDEVAGLPEAPAAESGRAIEQQFSPAEAKSVGLLDETAFALGSDVDIALDLPAVGDAPPIAPDPSAGVASDAPPAPAGTLAFDAPTIDAAPAESAEFADEDAEIVEGPRLRDHMTVGISYQLLLNGAWKKLRLSYMSPSRNFFLFAHGAKDLGTISMTSRMLDRLCAAHRLKAFEAAPLIDRATERARAQLAVPTAPAQTQPGTPA